MFRRDILLVNFFCLLILLTPLSASGGSISLYDNTLNNLPQDQGSLIYGGTALAYSLVNSGGNNYTNLSTTSNQDVRAGFTNYIPFFNQYRNPLFPEMDRAQGFSVEFDLALLSETHSSNDRAGFSLIALSSDNVGVEIGFWESSIWAQDDTTPLFTHGEGASYDTTQSLTTYRLDVFGDAYAMFANNSLLFSGGLKDYSAWTGVPSPYVLPNYLFFGDNTTSAQANVNLGKISLLTNNFQAIPEPATLLIMGLGIIGLAGYSRKNSI